MSSDEEYVAESSMKEIECAYATLEMETCIRNPLLFCQACSELSCIVSELYPCDVLPKAVKTSIETSCELALSRVDWTSKKQIGSLDLLMKVVSKHFPAKKRAHMKTTYRNAQIQASRRKRRVPEEFIAFICDEILIQIFNRLDPISLASVSCVCQHWRSLISAEDVLWKRLLRQTFGQDAVEQCEGNYYTGFRVFALQFPEALVVWSTRRFSIHASVRCMGSASWQRLLDIPGEYGIAMKGALYPRQPMFLRPIEVTRWLHRPSSKVLEELARDWKLLRDKRKLYRMS